MADTMTASVEQLMAFTGCLTDPPNFSIRIEGYEWRVHKEVLCKQSKFFEKACNGGFKESEKQVIELHDDCPWTVALMILGFYRGSSQTGSTDSNWAKTLGKMMAQGLEKSAFERLKEKHEKRETWETQARLYQLADKYDIQNLKAETRQLVVAAVKLDPSLLPKVLKFIDMSVVENDKELFRSLLEVSWRGWPSIQEMINIWLVTLARTEDVAMRSRVQASIFELADKSLAQQKSTLNSIEQSIGIAQKALVEADTRLTYQFNHSLVKEKIQVAKDALHTIQAKHIAHKC